MNQQHLRGGFGNAVTQTVVNPAVLVIVLILGVLVCFGSRKRAIAAFFSGAILIPMDQILVVGGMHFPMLRVLLLFGMVRMVRAKVSSKMPVLAGGWNAIDKAFLVLTIVTAVNNVLLFRDSGSVVFALGEMYTAFGAYFLLRYLLRSVDDLKILLRVWMWVTVIISLLMAYEQLTGRNPVYALLGGAHAQMFGSVLEREGRRATGTFGHPILAGTFGAISLPLFVGYWWKEKGGRTVGLLGIGACVLMAVAANSSTALLGFIGGIVGLCFWALRKNMRIIRWTISLTLIALHLVMKAPVWHLISRIDLSGGSSSYHRFQLINQCILHFSDWWLIGTKFYGDWGWDMWDLSNEYVSIADSSGLIALVAFLAMIVYGFKYLGKARIRAAGSRREALFIWAMGSSLFANVVAFLGIGYFDQTIVAWYALMAMISVIAFTAQSTPSSIRSAKRAGIEDSIQDMREVPSHSVS